LRGQTADNRLVIATEEKELGRSLKGQQADEQEEKMEIGEWSHQFSFSLIGEISETTRIYFIKFQQVNRSLHGLLLVKS
jgi:hypothetical protein